MLSAALKPVLTMVQQQWARRGAVALDSAQLTSVRAEVNEAIGVLARDADSLHQATFIWLKGLISDVSPSFDDKHVRNWLKTEGAAPILLATVETLLQAQPIDDLIASAGEDFARVTGEESWYGEAIALSAAAFVAASVHSKLTTGERMLAGLVNAQTAVVRQLLDVTAADLRTLIERLDARNGRGLSAASFVVQAVPTSTIIIGRRPRLDDLTAGRFRERPEIVRAASKAVVDWLKEADHEALIDGRLPLFWIEGRAGDGKSVVLLQTIAAIMEAGELATITELQTREELEAWLNSRDRGRTSAARLHWDIAFIDDLYRKFDGEELRTLISRIYHRGSPLAAIITSGPTIEREATERNDRVTITRFEVPPLDTEEMERFRTWMESRTGEARPSALAHNQLLVEWLVEMAGERPDTDFADNLAASLQRLGVHDIALVTAATNALDLGAPRALLEGAKAREAFAKLERDTDHFELRVEEDQAGIFLLHPALIWPLFQLWVRGEDSLASAWGRELGRATALFLKSGDRWQARSLVGRILRGEVLQRLFVLPRSFETRQIATVILETIHETVSKECTQLQRACLTSLWIAAANSQRLKVPDQAQLAEDAISAIQDTRVDVEVKADLAGALVAYEHLGMPENCADAALEFLSSAPTDVQVGVMRKLARSTRAGRRREHLMDWLRTNVGTAEAGPVFSQMLGSADDPEALALAFDYVRRNLAAEKAAEVMWSITVRGEGEDGYYKLLADWLNETADCHVAGRIVERLLLSTGGPRSAELQKRAHYAFAVEKHAARLSKGMTAFFDRASGTMAAAQLLAGLIRQNALRDAWTDRAIQHARATEGNIRRHVLGMLARFAPTRDVVALTLETVREEPTDRRNAFLLEQARNGVSSLGGEAAAALMDQLLPAERNALSGNTLC